MKRQIVFDLDGTLAESKSSLDAEMAARGAKWRSRRPPEVP